MESSLTLFDGLSCHCGPPKRALTAYFTVQAAMACFGDGFKPLKETEESVKPQLELVGRGARTLAATDGCSCGERLAHSMIFFSAPYFAFPPLAGRSLGPPGRHQGCPHFLASWAPAG